MEICEFPLCSKMENLRWRLFTGGLIENETKFFRLL